jgi:outer membrane protein assembly factor BamE
MMKTFKLSAIILSLFLTTIGLTGCGSYGWYPFLYHPSFSQGNVINPNAVNALKIGMTKEQVKNIMGSPLLDTPLSSDTWHYVYRQHEKNKLTQHNQLTLYFSGNRLVRIQ